MSDALIIGLGATLLVGYAAGASIATLLWKSKCDAIQDNFDAWISDHTATVASVEAMRKAQLETRCRCAKDVA